MNSKGLVVVEATAALGSLDSEVSGFPSLANARAVGYAASLRLRCVLKGAESLENGRGETETCRLSKERFQKSGRLVLELLGNPFSGIRLL